MTTAATRGLRVLSLLCCAVVASIGVASAQPALHPSPLSPSALHTLPYFEPTPDGGLIGRHLQAAVRISGTELLVAAPDSSNRVAGPLRIEFAGARRGAVVRGVDERRGRVNYLFGPDRATWRTDIRTYARGRTTDLYKAIDVEYYASGERLEYDFIVRPGADPNRIRLRANRAVSLTPAGELAFDDTDVVQRRPTAYQVVNGERVPVRAHYVLGRDRSVAIALDEYDHSRELVVDPLVLVSTTTVAGTGGQLADIVMNSDGSIIVGGTTKSVAFPTVHAIKPSVTVNECYAAEGIPTGQCSDGYVMKVARDGQVEFATYFGSDFVDDTVLTLDLDAAGNIYIRGDVFCIPSSIPCTVTHYLASLSADGQSIRLKVANPYPLSPTVATISPAGELLNLGSASAADGWGVSSSNLDPEHRIDRLLYLSDFPAQMQTIRAVPSGGFIVGGYFYKAIGGTPDAVVAQVEASGELRYVSRFGGSSGEYVSNIGVDADGTAWVTGTTTSPDFPFTGVLVAPAPVDQPFRGFLAHLDATGTLISARPFGAPSTRMSTQMAIAPDAVYTVGCGATQCDASRFDRDGREDGPYQVPPRSRFVVDEGGRQIFATSTGSPSTNISLTTYQWQEPPLVRLSADHRVPAPVGLPVTFTAKGSGVPPFEYQWWLYDAANGWHIVDPYGPHTTFTWTPTSNDVGTHALQVWIRATGSTMDLDSYAGTGYFDVADIPIPISLSSDAVFPRVAGTPIAWTATVPTDAGAVEYQFWLYSAALSTWRIVQDYGPVNTFVWTPSRAGDYGLQVNVRRVGSSRAVDTAINANYPLRITPPTPVRISAFEPDTPTTVVAGTPMTWTATAIGGVAPLQYRFILYDQTTDLWSELRPYGAAGSVVWTPSHAGTYGLQVWVRSAGSAALYDAWTSSPPVVVSSATAPTIVALRADKLLPPPAGASVTWTVDALGDGSPLEYKFLLYRGAIDTWSTARDFGPSPAWTWTGPTQPDVYAMSVWVRRKGSTPEYEAWAGTGYFTAGDGTISAPVLTSNQTFPVAVGTPITWTVVAGGGTAPLEYQFWLFDRRTSAWTVMQPWSSSPGWTWTTSAADFGVHAVQVWIRSQGSTAALDSFVGSGYFLIQP